MEKIKSDYVKKCFLVRQPVVEQIQGHPKLTFFESLQCQMGPIPHQLSHSKISYIFRILTCHYLLKIEAESTVNKTIFHNFQTKENHLHRKRSHWHIIGCPFTGFKSVTNYFKWCYSIVKVIWLRLYHLVNIIYGLYYIGYII